MSSIDYFQDAVNSFINFVDYTDGDSFKAACGSKEQSTRVLRLCHPDFANRTGCNEPELACLLEMCQCRNALITQADVRAESTLEKLDALEASAQNTLNVKNAVERAKSLLDSRKSSQPESTIETGQTIVLINNTQNSETLQAFDKPAVSAQPVDNINIEDPNTEPAANTTAALPVRNITTAAPSVEVSPAEAARQALEEATGSKGGGNRKQSFVVDSAKLAQDMRNGDLLARAKLYVLLTEQRQLKRNWLVREYLSFFALMGIEADPNCKSIENLLEKLNPANASTE